jgi:multidrug/hemolysin transport system permease protein
MRLVLVLIRRNITVFLRDRLTVSFTVMSPVILLLLFVVFFRQTTAVTIKMGFPHAPMADTYGLCDAWLFGSVVTLATFSCSLGMLASFVEDRGSGRFSDYLVSPVARWQLAVGYIAASFIVTVVVSTVLMLVGPLWATISGYAVMSPVEILQAIGAIAMGSLFYACFNVFFVTFLSSLGGLGGYSILTGVTTGFLSYCYVPPATLSSGIQNVVSSMPFAQSAALIREPVMQPAIERLVSVTDDPGLRAEGRAGLGQALAAQLEVGGHTLSTGLLLGALVLLSVIFISLGSLRMSRVIR